MKEEEQMEESGREEGRKSERARMTHGFSRIEPVSDKEEAPP